MSIAIQIDDEKFLESIKLYINTFHFSSKIPMVISPKSMTDFVLASHYGKGKDQSSNYSAKIMKGIKLRYGGDMQSPATDGQNIYLNRDFFSGSFYADKIGVPNEYIPSVAVLFYHGVTCHETAHCKIINENGLYQAEKLFESMTNNALHFSKLPLADFEKEIKGNKKREMYWILAMNMVEDRFIDRNLLPTKYGYTNTLYNLFLRTIFGYSHLANVFGEEFTVNHIHFLRNNEPKFNSWLLRTYPEISRFENILGGITYNTSFIGRAGVALRLFREIIDWHNETEDEDIDKEETEEEKAEKEKQLQEMRDKLGSSGEKSEGEGESEEFSESDEVSLKSFNKDSERKEQTQEEFEKLHANNHQWMENSVFTDVLSSEFTNREDYFSRRYGHGKYKIQMNEELAAYVNPLRYGRHKKSPRKTGLYDGVLDDNSLYRIREGNIFAEMKKNRKGKSDTSVVIMNDVSGSTLSQMGKGYVCVELLSLGYSLHTLLKKVGINVASLAHTTGQASEIYGIGANKMRLTKGGKKVTTHRDLESYSQVLEKARYSGNCDGAALRYSSHLFDETDTNRKIIIMINDGEPAESHIQGLNGRNALVQELETVRSKGFIVVAFAAVESVYDKLCNIYGKENVFRGYGKYIAEDSKKMIKRFMMFK